MSKQEFLSELSECLSGEVTQVEYNDSMRYYTNYFEEAIRGGEQEEGIVTLLGSPRLIAKSIIEANQMSREQGSAYEETYYKEDPQPEKGFHAQYDGDKMDIRYGKFRLNTWYGKLVAVLIGIVIVVALFGLLGIAFRIFWNVVLPILVVVWIASTCIRLFQRR